MDLEEYQILYGPPNEARSFLDCLKYMPPGGGSDRWRHLPRPPEGQHQLEVFLYRSRDGAAEQKVVDFIRWLEDSSDVGRYMGMVNLVQLWVPIVGGDANDETILSVSEQPFGVGRLSNGICRYRYDSILRGRKTCPGDGGDIISTAFTLGLALFDHYQQHHHHRYEYGIQTRWALPLVDRGIPVGVLEFVTGNDYRAEHHGMLTQSFLEFGPRYYQQFCRDMMGTSLESVQESSHDHHSLTQENMIFGNDNLWWPTMYDLSNGLFGNANEDLTNSSNSFAHQFPTQENTGRTVNFEVGETSGTNLSYGTIFNWRCGNAIEDPRVVPYEEEYHLIDQISNLVDDHQHLCDPVPTLESTGGTNDPIDEISDFFGDPTIRGVAEDELVAAQENIGGDTNDIIQETSGMVQKLNLGPSVNDNSNTTQRTSPPAASRKRRRPTIDQLQQFFGRALQEAADEMGVHRSTIKRWCRDWGIPKWPSCNKRNKATLKNMIVKARYGEMTVRVRNFDSTKEFEWLSKELGVKLKLQVGSFRIQYKDDSGDHIPITCTKHLMNRLDSLFSSNMKIMYLIVTRSN